jgi:hypothetical protein
VHAGLDRKAVDLDSPRALLAAGERGLIGKQLLLATALWIQPLEASPRERRLPAMSASTRRRRTVEAGEQAVNSAALRVLKG